VAGRRTRSSADAGDATRYMEAVSVLWCCRVCYLVGFGGGVGPTLWWGGGGPQGAGAGGENKACGAVTAGRMLVKRSRRRLSSDRAGTPLGWS